MPSHTRVPWSQSKHALPQKKRSDHLNGDLAHSSLSRMVITIDTLIADSDQRSPVHVLGLGCQQCPLIPVIPHWTPGFGGRRRQRPDPSDPYDVSTEGCCAQDPTEPWIDLQVFEHLHRVCPDQVL